MFNSYVPKVKKLLFFGIGNTPLEGDCLKFSLRFPSGIHLILCPLAVEVKKDKL
jgi:hypothetical protein